MNHKQEPMIEFLTIDQAFKEIGIGKTSLYAHLKKLKISPKKKGNRSYITNTQITKIKEYRASVQDNSQPFAEQINTPNTIKGQEFLQKALGEQKEQNRLEREKNEALHKKIEDLSLEVGRWQGRAKTLEEHAKELETQNQKLLTQQAETIQAEIIEDEAPEPTKTRTFAQKWRDFWKD